MQFSLWIFVKAADCWECSFMASSPRHCPCMTTHAWPVSPAGAVPPLHPGFRLGGESQESEATIMRLICCWLLGRFCVLAPKIIPTYLESFPDCRSVFLSSLPLGILKQDIDEFERYLYHIFVYIRYLGNLISNSLFRLSRNLAPLSRK